MSVALSVILQGIPTSVGELFAQYGDLVLAFGVRILTFIVAFLVLYRIGKSVFVRMVKRALDSREFSSAVVSLGSSIAGAVALFGAVAVAAAVAGVDAILTAFATITGALALGVAFAAGDIIENFVAGIFILKDKPFEVGDHIEWNGNDGIVRKIDLRVTKLDTFNNEQVTVPNGDLANSVVMNPVANETRRVAVRLRYRVRRRHRTRSRDHHRGSPQDRRHPRRSRADRAGHRARRFGSRPQRPCVDQPTRDGCWRRQNPMGRSRQDTLR